jgi:hypothetical protein
MQQPYRSTPRVAWKRSAFSENVDDAVRSSAIRGASVAIVLALGVPLVVDPGLGALAGEAAGGESPPANPSQPAAALAAPPSTAFLLIRADRQSVDQATGKLVATGNVEARFGGWLLRADRVEVLESSRSIYASGQLRLYRGDQMLQASRLRYSQLEGSGELDDVYGVIDQEGLTRELAALAKPEASPGGGATPGATARAEASASPFACPPLQATAGDRPVLHLVPPRKEALPTMPAPRGCPGDDAAARPNGLRQALTDVALGARRQTPPAKPTPAVTTTQESAIPQRVEGVRFRQSVDTSIKLDLVAVIDTEEEVDSGGRPTGASVIRRPKPARGKLNRLRFQASRVTVRDNRWTAPEVAFTNDPFTPAQSWTIGYQVEAVVEPAGITRLRARRSRILLSNRVSVPGINQAAIGEEALQFTLDTDQRDRDGIFLGYNLPRLRIGDKGKLELQPQFLVQRAIQGRTDSYTAPGKSLAGPRVNQDLKAGDLFGLVAALDAPIGRFRLKADTSVSTFSPDNIAAGTRSIVNLGTPLGLPAHNTSEAQVFGAYRERVYNGSLGLQTVAYAYGGQAGGVLNFNADPTDPALEQRRTPYFGPFNLDWRAVGGSYRAALFESEDLETQWRARFNAGLQGSLRLWEASLDPERESLAALRYSPLPVRPGLALDFGLATSLAQYEDGARQNTLTLFGGPSFTLGRFRQPWMDYTQVALLFGGTLRDGVSPFGFDRAVDLRTVSFRAAQQLYGPLVLEAGATVNVDANSRFYGDVSYSYVELKLQQRSYELGVYYSPYDGIGGIRVRLNDFSFRGGGTPFVPRPASPRPTSEGGAPLNRRPGSS